MLSSARSVALTLPAYRRRRMARTITIVVRAVLLVMLALFFKLLVIAAYLWVVAMIVGAICLIITCLRYTFWRPHAR
jgi:hypothetical protein